MAPVPSRVTCDDSAAFISLSSERECQAKLAQYFAAEDEQRELQRQTQVQRQMQQQRQRQPRPRQGPEPAYAQDPLDPPPPYDDDEEITGHEFSGLDTELQDPHSPRIARVIQRARIVVRAPSQHMRAVSESVSESSTQLLDTESFLESGDIVSIEEEGDAFQYLDSVPYFEGTVSSPEEDSPPLSSPTPGPSQTVSQPSEQPVSNTETTMMASPAVFDKSIQPPTTASPQRKHSKRSKSKSRSKSKAKTRRTQDVTAQEAPEHRDLSSETDVQQSESESPYTPPEPMVLLPAATDEKPSEQISTPEQEADTLQLQPEPSDSTLEPVSSAPAVTETASVCTTSSSTLPLEPKDNDQPESNGQIKHDKEPVSSEKKVLEEAVAQLLVASDTIISVDSAAGTKPDSNALTNTQTQVEVAARNALTSDPTAMVSLDAAPNPEQECPQQSKGQKKKQRKKRQKERLAADAALKRQKIAAKARPGPARVSGQSQTQTRTQSQNQSQQQSEIEVEAQTQNPSQPHTSNVPAVQERRSSAENLQSHAEEQVSTSSVSQEQSRPVIPVQPTPAAKPSHPQKEQGQETSEHGTTDKSSQRQARRSITADVVVKAPASQEQPRPAIPVQTASVIEHTSSRKEQNQETRGQNTKSKSSRDPSQPSGIADVATKEPVSASAQVSQQQTLRTATKSVTVDRQLARQQLLQALKLPREQIRSRNPEKLNLSHETNNGLGQKQQPAEPRDEPIDQTQKPAEAIEEEKASIKLALRTTPTPTHQCRDPVQESSDFVWSRSVVDHRTQEYSPNDGWHADTPREEPHGHPHQPPSAPAPPPRMLEAQYNSFGLIVVDPRDFWPDDERCSSRPRSLCSFYSACCNHRPRSDCSCPPRSCCCIHHSGDCCHCLHKKGVTGVFITQQRDGALTLPRYPHPAHRAQSQVQGVFGPMRMTGSSTSSPSQQTYYYYPTQQRTWDQGVEHGSASDDGQPWGRLPSGNQAARETSASIEGDNVSEDEGEGGEGRQAAMSEGKGGGRPECLHASSSPATANPHPASTQQQPAAPSSTPVQIAPPSTSASSSSLLPPPHRSLPSPPSPAHATGSAHPSHSLRQPSSGFPAGSLYQPLSSSQEPSRPRRQSFRRVHFSPSRTRQESACPPQAPPLTPAESAHRSHSPPQTSSQKQKAEPAHQPRSSSQSLPPTQKTESAHQPDSSPKTSSQAQETESAHQQHPTPETPLQTPAESAHKQHQSPQTASQSRTEFDHQQHPPLRTGAPTRNESDNQQHQPPQTESQSQHESACQRHSSSHSQSQPSTELSRQPTPPPPSSQSPRESSHQVHQPIEVSSRAPTGSIQSSHPSPQSSPQTPVMSAPQPESSVRPPSQTQEEPCPQVHPSSRSSSQSPAESAQQSQLPQQSLHTPTESEEPPQASQPAPKTSTESDQSQPHQPSVQTPAESVPQTAGETPSQTPSPDPAPQTPKKESNTGSSIHPSSPSGDLHKDSAEDCHSNPPARTNLSEEEWKRLSFHLCHLAGEPEWSDVTLEVKLLERPGPLVHIKTHQEILRRSTMMEILLDSSQEEDAKVPKVRVDCGVSFWFVSAVNAALAHLYGHPLLDTDCLKTLTCFELGYQSTTDPRIIEPTLRRAMADYALSYASAGKFFSQVDIMRKGYNLACEITDFDNVETMLMFCMRNRLHAVTSPDLPQAFKVDEQAATEESEKLSEADQKRLSLLNDCENHFHFWRDDTLKAGFRYALQPVLNRKFKLYTLARAQFSEDRIPQPLRTEPGTSACTHPAVGDIRFGRMPPLSTGRPKEPSTLVPSVLLLTLPSTALSFALGALEQEGRVLRAKLLREVVEEREARRLHALRVNEQRVKKGEELPEEWLRELGYRESVAEVEAAAEEEAEAEGGKDKGKGKGKGVVTGGVAKGGKPAMLKPVVKKEWVGVQAGIAASCSSVVVVAGHNKSKKAKRKEAKARR